MVTMSTASPNTPATGRYQFIVSLDVDADKEDLFNEVYDSEHIPYLLAVPGVLSVRRLRALPFRVTLGGESKTVGAATPRYRAIYELTSPDVLTSAAWAEAVERGRWPGEVRPYTRNRRHELREILP